MPRRGRGDRPRVATIRDVARRAGVSPATVSRVLNGRPSVRAGARAAVEAAVGALGFRPNGLARGLGGGRTRTIGLIVADIVNPFYAETARAIVEAARGGGYTVVLCNTDNLGHLMVEQIRMLRDQRVEGIILGSAHRRDPAVEALVASGFPCVMYNRRLASGAGSYVVLDNVRAGTEATRHFLRLGHRRIAFLAGPASFSTAAERLAGYRRALAAAGAPFDPRLVRQGQFRAEQAYQAALDLFGGSPRPTAVVAGNDLMALAVLDAADHAGLRVPEDVAVCGFDDTDIAANARIQLTSVAQQKAEMGRLAVGYLLEFLDAPQRFVRHPIHHVLPPTLVVRRSCGAMQGGRRQGRRTA